MTEYLTFLGQYTETMGKFDALENSDLNDAELNYGPMSRFSTS